MIALGASLTPWHPICLLWRRSDSFGGRARMDAMARSATPADLIVEAIVHHPGCCLDDLVGPVPN